MDAKNTSQPPSQEDKRICLGKIVAAHGVKGLVKLLPYGDDVTLLGGTLYTAERGDKTLQITLKNSLGKYILAEIDGVHDRTQAEAIRGTELYMQRAALPDAEDGRYYFDDLLGLAALNESGKEIGKIIAVENYGAGDLLEIKPKSGEAFLIPFTKDNVPQVDLSGGTLTVLNSDMYK